MMDAGMAEAANAEVKPEADAEVKPEADAELKEPKRKDDEQKGGEAGGRPRKKRKSHRRTKEKEGSAKGEGEAPSKGEGPPGEAPPKGPPGEAKNVNSKPGPKLAFLSPASSSPAFWNLRGFFQEIPCSFSQERQKRKSSEKDAAKKNAGRRFKKESNR